MSGELQHLNIEQYKRPLPPRCEFEPLGWSFAMKSLSPSASHQEFTLLNSDCCAGKRKDNAQEHHVPFMCVTPTFLRHQADYCYCQQTGVAKVMFS